MDKPPPPPPNYGSPPPIHELYLRYPPPPVMYPCYQYPIPQVFTQPPPPPPVVPPLNIPPPSNMMSTSTPSLPDITKPPPGYLTHHVQNNESSRRIKEPMEPMSSRSRDNCEYRSRTSHSRRSPCSRSYGRHERSRERSSHRSRSSRYRSPSPHHHHHSRYPRHRTPSPSSRRRTPSPRSRRRTPSPRSRRRTPSPRSRHRTPIPRSRRGYRSRTRSRSRISTAHERSAARSVQDEPKTDRQIILAEFRRNYCTSSEQLVEKLSKWAKEKENSDEPSWYRSSPAELYYKPSENDVRSGTQKLLEICEGFGKLIERGVQARPEVDEVPPLPPQKGHTHSEKCESSDSETSESEDESGHSASERVMQELQRKQTHPRRLHIELWYNSPGEMNSGPLCRCSAKARKLGVRHGVYAGEPKLPKCDPMTNNIDKLFHYRVTVSPPTNFLVKSPTIISHDEHEFLFSGFSLFSHYKLDELPICKVIRFNIEYTILYEEEPAPSNFCIKELELFEEFIFTEVLELYDLDLGKGDGEHCSQFHIMPRFVRNLPENGQEVLSMCEVLKYIQRESKLLIPPEMLEEVHSMDHFAWQRFVDKIKGTIVTKPGMKPCSLRVDQLDRSEPDDISHKSNDKKRKQMTKKPDEKEKVTKKVDLNEKRSDSEKNTNFLLEKSQSKNVEQEKDSAKNEDNEISESKGEERCRSDRERKSVSIQDRSKNYEQEKDSLRNEERERSESRKYERHRSDREIRSESSRDRSKTVEQEKDSLKNKDRERSESKKDESHRSDREMRSESNRDRSKNYEQEKDGLRNEDRERSETRKDDRHRSDTEMRSESSRDILKRNEGDKERKKKKLYYPEIVHFGIRPPQLSYAGNPEYQKKWRYYVKLRHLVANMPKPCLKDKQRLQAREAQLQEMRTHSKMKRDVTVAISSEGFYSTGLACDVIQHCMLIPVLVRHLRFHKSLDSLEKNIQYKFKSRALIQMAFTHPSYRENFGTNPDHARNSLTNCGIRQPEYGDRRIHYINTRKRGINTLIDIMSRFGRKNESESAISHNERLEFLGDAVVEFLSSTHLFRMFPGLAEGGLATFRAAVVQNQHLAQLAKKLSLEQYMLYAHGSDLCGVMELRHAMANCFEALMGALFIDGGIEEVDKVFSLALWRDEEDLLQVWCKPRRHPLQEQEPLGDRKYIPHFKLLQRLQKFEDYIGIRFRHIRLLARAFTDRSVGFTNLTLGSNQRLEFLGDTVLQLLVSDKLYRHFPDHHEGHLSLLRSSLVNNKTQARVCDDLAMSSFALYNHSKAEPSLKDKADLLEAFLGALYIDKNMEYCAAFCDAVLFPRLREFILNQDWNDPKSKLQQCCLTLRMVGDGEPDIPVYKVIECLGPTNTRVYTVAVYFRGKRLAAASGHSIQEAEMNAAKEALGNAHDLFPQLDRQKRVIAKCVTSKTPIVEKNDKESIDVEKGESKTTKRTAKHQVPKAYRLEESSSSDSSDDLNMEIANLKATSINSDSGLDSGDECIASTSNQHNGELPCDFGSLGQEINKIKQKMLETIKSPEKSHTTPEGIKTTKSCKSREKSRRRISSRSKSSRSNRSIEILLDKAKDHEMTTISSNNVDGKELIENDKTLTSGNVVQSSTGEEMDRSSCTDTPAIGNDNCNRNDKFGVELMSIGEDEKALDKIREYESGELTDD